MKRYYATLSILGALFISCGGHISIINTPIQFNQERKNLTVAYKQIRYGLRDTTVLIRPQMIVIHHTVIPTFEKTIAAFDNPTLPNWRPDLEQVSGLNVSSQYVVDRDGTIHQLMPDNYMARHVIGLNHCAIGIENVGGTEDLPLTRAQLRANKKLVQYLTKKYPIEYLIGHYEYQGFENHPLWLEVSTGYRTQKSDPSQLFMTQLRKATQKLNLKGIPK